MQELHGRARGETYSGPFTSLKREDSFTTLVGQEETIGCSRESRQERDSQGIHKSFVYEVDCLPDARKPGFSKPSGKPTPLFPHVSIHYALGRSVSTLIWA